MYDPRPPAGLNWSGALRMLVSVSLVGMVLWVIASGAAAAWRAAVWTG
jgi:hypothetical protein